MGIVYIHMICTVIKGGPVINKQIRDCFNFARTIFVLRAFWQEAVLTGNLQNK